MSDAAPNRTTSSEPGAGAAARASDNLVNLRRRSDWTGEMRPGEDARYAAYRAAIDVAAATLAAFDCSTGDHSDDVCAIAGATAGRLGLSEEQCSHVLAGAQLHDIGKVGVPSQVISKTGPLDAAEWELIRQHTVKGERILAAVPEMAEVARIVRHSHERWDGGGYPDGLSGEDIPLGSRIVFCADAFHAIRSDRPYRRGRSARRAFAEIEKQSGGQFDPQVVEALRGVAEELAARRRRKAVFSSKRTQRLAALLLALSISSSALAATGAWRGMPLVGRDRTPPAVAGKCGPARCLGPAPPLGAGDLPQALVPVTALAGARGKRLARAGGSEASANGSPAAGHPNLSATSPGGSRAAPAPGASAPAGSGPSGGHSSVPGAVRRPTSLPDGPLEAPVDAGTLPEVRAPDAVPDARLPSHVGPLVLPKVKPHIGLGGGR